MPLRLTDDGFAAIKNSGSLFGKVADALRLSPYTLADRLRDAKLEKGEKNNPCYTQLEVLQLISEETGRTTEELTTEADSSINQDSKVES